MGLGITVRKETPLGISAQADSAALHLRLPAFGGLCSAFVLVLGFEPVTALTLALVATIVLAKV